MTELLSDWSRVNDISGATTEFPAYADKWRRLFAEKGYGARPAPAAMR